MICNKKSDRRLAHSGVGRQRESGQVDEKREGGGGERLHVVAVVAALLRAAATGTGAGVGARRVGCSQSVGSGVRLLL